MNGVDLKVSTGNIVDTKADAIVVSVGAKFELHGKFDYPTSLFVQGRSIARFCFVSFFLNALKRLNYYYCMLCLCLFLQVERARH